MLRLSIQDFPHHQTLSPALDQQNLVYIIYLIIPLFLLTPSNKDPPSQKLTPFYHKVNIHNSLILFWRVFLLKIKGGEM